MLLLLLLPITNDTLNMIIVDDGIQPQSQKGEEYVLPTTLKRNTYLLIETNVSLGFHNSVSLRGKRAHGGCD